MARQQQASPLALTDVLAQPALLDDPAGLARAEHPDDVPMQAAAPELQQAETAFVVPEGDGPVELVAPLTLVEYD